MDANAFMQNGVVNYEEVARVLAILGALPQPNREANVDQQADVGEFDPVQAAVSEVEVIYYYCRDKAVTFLFRILLPLPSRKKVRTKPCTKDSNSLSTNAIRMRPSNSNVYN